MLYLITFYSILVVTCVKMNEELKIHQQFSFWRRFGEQFTKPCQETVEMIVICLICFTKIKLQDK